MRTIPILVLAASSLPAIPSLAQATKPGDTRGSLEAVTVYRGQALVTRLVEVAGTAGLSEIVVTDLPVRIDPASLHAEGSADLQVRSVRYRARPVAQDVREDVRKIDTQVAALQDQQRAAQRRVELLGEEKAYLTSLQNFVAPTATAEMTRGVLNADTLAKLTEFVLQKRSELAESDLKLQKELQTIEQQINVLQRERQEITAGSSTTVQEAVVFVNKVKDAPAFLRLRYLVGDATWEPSYNVRSDPGRGGVTLEYFASVQQMSGEDWGGVAMTLSTATPALVSKAPTLEPMTLALASPEQQQVQLGVGQSADYFQIREELSKSQREVENRRQLANAPASKSRPAEGERGRDEAQADKKEFEKRLNTLANDLQVLDLVTSEHIARKDRAERPKTEEGLSVTYTLQGKATLPSRADRQLVQIASVPMKAEFAKVAVPALTNYIYDEASLTNTSGRVLLAGPVTAYSDGAFVGGDELPTIAMGQPFTLGFGIDATLHAERELIEKTETTQGGNRVVELTYRLSIEHFGDAPTHVRLLDRMPKVRDSEIKITLLPVGRDPTAESEGAARKDGILRWDVEVPAQAIGAKTFAQEYKLRMEYDKQMTIIGMGEPSR